MLTTENLSCAFGGVQAVSNVSINFERGRTIGLIGPNGAGKTTIFNLITGLIRPSAGRVLHDGHEITGLPIRLVAGRGIGRSFQHTRLISAISAVDNVTMALPAIRSAFWPMLAMGRTRMEELRAEASTWLDRVGLGSVKHRLGADLSHAEQKLVMLAALLASGANTLLLDEPCAGLDPASRREVVSAIGALRSPDLTIVLIEHNLDVIRGLCDRIVFLAEGKVVTEGTAEEIERDPHLAKLYFGSMEGHQ